MNAHLKNALRPAYPLLYPLLRLLHRWVITPVNLRRNARKPARQLDIGPGRKRIAGFETLDIHASLWIDYVCDISKPLPFADESFDLVHASHVLEHIPWHQSQVIIKEWVRLLKPGGVLEVWVPNGYKICKLLCDVEDNTDRSEWRDGWLTSVTHNDPYRWVNGRLLYGIRSDYPSWHTAILTPKSLQELMRRSGLVNIQELDPSSVRSVDHGWINMGFSGTRA